MISPGRQGMRSVLKLSYSPLLDRAALRNQARVLEQMADDIRVIATNCDGVVSDDLELLGWTPEQIASHGKAAARLARSRADAG